MCGPESVHPERSVERAQPFHPSKAPHRRTTPVGSQKHPASRAEQRRAEQSRAGQGRAGQGTRQHTLHTWLWLASCLRRTNPTYKYPAIPTHDAAEACSCLASPTPVPAPPPAYPRSSIRSHPSTIHIHRPPSPTSAQRRSRTQSFSLLAPSHPPFPPPGPRIFFIFISPPFLFPNSRQRRLSHHHHHHPPLPRTCCCCYCCHPLQLNKVFLFFSSEPLRSLTRLTRILPFSSAHDPDLSSRKDSSEPATSSLILPAVPPYRDQYHSCPSPSILPRQASHPDAS